MNDFGVIIVCYAGDVHLARGCCASIRHFLGDVPICLIVDGDVDVDDFVRAYGVQVIRQTDFADRALRETCFGWGRTKMIAHWEAPWPTFLLVDADTVLWGDIRRHARFDQFEMITDRHIADSFPGAHNALALASFLGEAATLDTLRKRRHVTKWFYDVAMLGEIEPEIDWEATVERLFCTGAYFSRRGALNRERFLHLVALARQWPGLFSRGEMGVHNALALNSAIRIDQRSDMHQLVYMSSAEELARRFPVGPEGPLVSDEAVVIHWAGGMKPTLDGRLAYSEPMNFFRRKFLHACGMNDSLAIDARLADEDEIYADLHAIPQRRGAVAMAAG